VYCILYTVPQKNIDILFKELDALATHHKLTAESSSNLNDSISPVGTHGVFLSDYAISESVRETLIAQSHPLEAEAHRNEQWHPNSNNQVLDLVHPSNYCLVFGRTGFAMYPGTIIPDFVFHAQTEKNSGVSDRFQWLPSTVSVDPNGSCKFESYINDLSPKRYSGLCSTISKVFGTMLPLFERAVGSLDSEPKRRVDASYANYDLQDISLDDDHDKQLEEYRQERKKARETNPDPALEGLTEKQLRDRDRDSFFDNRIYRDRRQVIYPEFPDNLDGTTIMQNFITPTCLRPLKNSKLKVIVKMANIYLTPEKPTYNGGSWHIEGMENEAIAATGIYYYSMENITESKVRFRHTFNEDVFAFMQHDYYGLERVYGFENEGLALQELTFVKAMEGRCVVFPNFLHHRVSVCHDV
jgi:hypothetical protein